MATLKEKAHSQCLGLCNERIALAEGEMEALSSALREETKSSAGDKYETSRSMINLEKEKVQENLLSLINQRRAISQIDPTKTTKKVELGSLLTSASGAFFISTSLGKLDIDGENVFAISPISPIGQAMLGLASGESFEFNGKKDSILDLS
ncbi:MAG: 3-oxoacyl-ACP synthase [Cytophagales bacterium]|nr:3-oxoacyl-ACP synthase [Cytophagales bacterium]